MNWRVFTFSMAILVIGFFVAAQVYEDYLKARQQITDISSEISFLEKEIKVVLAYNDKPIRNIDIYINYLYEYSRIFADINDYKCLINVSEIIPSSHAGIRQVYSSLNFYDLSGPDQYFHVFQFVKQLITDEPLEVAEVSYSKDSLGVSILIYGS